MATVLLKLTKGAVQYVIHFSQAKGIHPIGINHEMGEFRSVWSSKIKVPCNKKNARQQTWDRRQQPFFRHAQCDFGEFHSPPSGATTNDGHCQRTLTGFTELFAVKRSTAVA
jgi:hypothetical protein